MAKTCFPLDDTNYFAKDVRLWHIGRTHGIINHTGNDLYVKAAGGMNVTLGPGYLYMYTGSKDPGGFIYGNDEEESLSGPPANAYVRYDYICIEYDESQNDAFAKYVTGGREMPTPVRNETQFQEIVAVIRVKANASEISNEDIIDTRMNEDYCGLAVDMLSKIPTDQYYEQFMAFMKTIEGILGEDEAGNLLNLINEIKANEQKPNLLDNADFSSGIINQKGQTTYTITQQGGKFNYFIDRWKVWVETGRTFTCNVKDGYIEVKIEGIDTGAMQQDVVLEDGVQYIVTAKIDGEIRQLLFTGGETIKNDYIKASGSGTSGYIAVIFGNTLRKIEWVKLEKGSIFTGMPIWKKQEELAKCKRYFRPLPTTFIGYAWGTDGWGYQNCPDIMDMAKTPTITLVKGSNDGQLKVMDNGSLKTYVVNTPEANIYSGYIRWKGLATWVNYSIVGFFNVDKIYADANTY